MYNKGFPRLTALVMIIAITGCDNVEWAGVDLELRPPPARETVPVAEAVEPGEPVLEPLELGTLIYAVERTGPSAASILPVAEVAGSEYRPLPDPEEIEHFVARFPLNRWGEGVELVLFAQGVRVGTLTLQGPVEEDRGTCLLRPRGQGSLELHPGAAGLDRFLALRKEDLPGPLVPQEYPGLQDNFQLRAGTLDVARILIPRVQAPWPPSIPEIRRHYAPFPLPDGQTGLAASFVYAGELEVGEAPPLAYSLFYLAREEAGTFRPALSWYQRVREGGKAFPRFLASHDVRDTGAPDVLLQTFGEEDTWFTVLGMRDGTWGVIYQDPCGLPVPAGAIRTHP
jgi:hypothetical protein